MAPALVSIIVPVYNVAPYLGECLDSIVRQTYGNIEIIVVDDGSTDGSAELCDEWVKRDNRIRVIHQPNGGLSVARNTGLNGAQGDYLSFVDSDDTISPVFIETLLSAGADVAQCSSCRSAEKLEKESWRPTFEYLSNVEASKILQFDSTGDATVVWNKLYRRTLFDDIRFPVGKQHEDDFVTSRILWDANQVAVTRRALYYYRPRPGSTMNCGFNEKSFDAIEALDNRAAFYKEIGSDLLCSDTNIVACYRLWDILSKAKQGSPELLDIWLKEADRRTDLICEASYIGVKKRISLKIKRFLAKLSLN